VIQLCAKNSFDTFEAYFLLIAKKKEIQLSIQKNSSPVAKHNCKKINLDKESF
jgi:hypothetical protein